jgi:hypothetical protein
MMATANAQAATDGTPTNGFSNARGMIFQCAKKNDSQSDHPFEYEARRILRAFERVNESPAQQPGNNQQQHRPADEVVG